MKNVTLTLLDTSGIQNYIFNSNRLQENIGASELVYRATTLWAFAALSDAGFKHNVEVQGNIWKINDGDIEKENSTLRAEVIYAGGGNILILFQNLDDAKNFTKRITTQVLKEAPGLTLVASHLEFEFASVQLAIARSSLLRQLAQHKQSRLPSLPLLGLGVSAVCQSTGLPATRTNVGLKLNEDEEDTRLISREIEWKLKYRNPGNDRLKDALGRAAGSYYFPSDVDKLGRIKGEESYVAIVHADGNRMGEHLNEAIKNATDNRDCIRKLRAFSTKINDASLKALLHVVKLAKQAADDELVPIVEKYLPMRPLVFGGDDVTFLCNGRLGISLATAYLESFERETKILGLDRFHASVGVSIVKMHYPFARAYALSEQLLSSAKRFVREFEDCSAIDWHFATSGLSGSLSVIREREYQDGNLLMRPLLLNKNDKVKGRFWKGGIEEVIRQFREEHPWKDSHNKVIGLRDVLRDTTGEQVRAYLRDYELSRLPELVNEEAQTTGWTNNRCVYFDAIELLDHHIAIAEKQEVPA